LKRLFSMLSLFFIVNLVGAESPQLTNLSITVGNLRIFYNRYDASSPLQYIEMEVQPEDRRKVIALTLHEDEATKSNLLLNKNDVYFKTENYIWIWTFSNNTEEIIKSEKYKGITLIDDQYNEYYFDTSVIIDTINTIYKMIELADQNKIITGNTAIQSNNEVALASQNESSADDNKGSATLDVPGKELVPYSGYAVTIRKTEKGSSSDTILGGYQGTVGQNIYQPVYLSLPLPQTIFESVYRAIPDLIIPPNIVIYSSLERKKTFTTYYEFDGSFYRLKSDVPMVKRELLWQILEDAGFDPAKTDYREGKTLNPVVITFNISKDNQLRDAKVLQSSGDPHIDQGVLYGFRRAVFWNKTGETIPGRFTYRFD
jgi:TonB family protein